jgi:hypothetical protein
VEQVEETGEYVLAVLVRRAELGEVYEYRGTGSGWNY